MLAALPFAVWLYLAIEQLPLAAEESHDPKKDMPKGLLLGIATATGVGDTSLGAGGLRVDRYGPGTHAGSVLVRAGDRLYLGGLWNTQSMVAAYALGGGGSTRTIAISVSDGGGTRTVTTALSPAAGTVTVIDGVHRFTGLARETSYAVQFAEVPIGSPEQPDGAG